MNRKRNNRSSIKLKSFSQCVNELSREASVLLFTGLPVTLIALLGYLSEVLIAMNTEPLFALVSYPPMLEYIFMALTVTVLGSVVLDISDKQSL
jgi:predicted membrane-bound mannosyltransferase